MDQGLLDDDTFAEKLEELASDVEETKLLSQSIANAASVLRDDQSQENYSHFVEIKSSLEQRVASVRQLTLGLTDGAKSNEVRQKRIDKVQSVVKKMLSEYDSKKPEYDTLLKSYAGSKPSISKPKSTEQTTNAGSVGRDKSNSNMPVMQVFSQAEFADKRQKDVEKLHAEAKDVRNIAVDINAKVYKQEEKLEQINKKMDREVLGNLKKGNEDLMKAEEVGAKRNKNYCFLIILLVVGLGIIGSAVYFMFQ